MNYLVDTHLLIWAADHNPKLSFEAEAELTNPRNNLWFSVISLWEMTLKRSMNRKTFAYDAGQMRSGFLASGYQELAVESKHVLGLANMPTIHTDPFDRLLLAQAISEGLIFLTADRQMAAYGNDVKIVR